MFDYIRKADGGMSDTQKKIGIIVLLSLFFLCICWYLGRDSGITESEIAESTGGSYGSGSISATKEPAIETEILRILQGNNIYSVRDTSASGYHYVYVNNNFIGESLYTPANSDRVVMYDLSSLQSTDEYSGEGVYSDEQTVENEETADEPMDISDGLSMEYRAVEEGLVYQMDKVQTRLYLQTLYSEGYTLDTQIATSVYNKLYLHKVETDSWYSVIVVNSMDLVIVSELDNFSGVDINKIMEIQ